MIATQVRYFAAAAVVGFAGMSFSAPSGAGGLDLGGLVGGALGGTSYSGTSGGVSAKADASIGYSGVDAKAKASIGGIKAKAYVALYKKKHHADTNLLLGKQRTYGKVTVSLGGKTKVKSKVALGGLVNVKVGANLGGNGRGRNDGAGPGASGSTPIAMAGTFRDLSMHDQYIMTKKCSTVLAAQSRYDSDMVALCRIIVTL
jgi:hypothetical protein